MCCDVSNPILRILCQMKTKSYRYNFFLTACLRALVRKSKSLQYMRGSPFPAEAEHFWVGASDQNHSSSWLATAEEEELCMLHCPELIDW